MDSSGPLGPKLGTEWSTGAFFALAEPVFLGRTGAGRLIDIATKQLGVVTRADLISSGVSGKWLQGRLRTGEWKRVHRGVFRLGCHPPSRDEREMAALLAAGEEAVLSHTSAARRLGLDVPPENELHLTIPASRKRRVPGAKVWRSKSLTTADVKTRGRFRLTNLARTMIDLAAVLDDGWLRAAFDSAVRQNQGNAGWIRRVLAKHGPGCRGVGRLRALAEEYRRGEEVPDSALESLGVELARATGRRAKLHYDVLDGARHVAEVDLAWPELRLCVQFDGWKYHRTGAAFVRDRACDRALFHMGWHVLHYPWQDVVHDPDTFVEDLVRSFSRAASWQRSEEPSGPPRLAPP